MSDYISREAASEKAEYDVNYRLVVPAEAIKGLPAADVEPVRHGAWYPCFEDWRQQQEGNKCSVCGFEYYGTGIRAFHYCPNCCAKMDLI